MLRRRRKAEIFTNYLNQFITPYSYPPLLCYIHTLEIDLLGYVGERGRWRQREEEKVAEEIFISVT